MLSVAAIFTLCEKLVCCVLVMITNFKANKAPKFGLESTYLKIYNLAMSLSEEMWCWMSDFER